MPRVVQTIAVPTQSEARVVRLSTVKGSAEFDPPLVLDEHGDVTIPAWAHEKLFDEPPAITVEAKINI